MISVGTIQNDTSIIEGLFDQYKECLNDIRNDSIWQGASRDNAYNKGEEFINEFKHPISNQMENLVMAVKLFNRYKTVKVEKEQAEQSYNKAVSTSDNDSLNYYTNKIQEKTSEMNNLKAKIEELLSEISRVKLNSIVIQSTPTSAQTSTSAPAGKTVQSAIDWAIATARNNRIGYSQNARWGNPNYDCSSFVISAYQNAGIDVKGAGANSTHDMKRAFTSSGFTWIPGPIEESKLQPGDVLLDESAHTELYIGEGKAVGAHSNYDSQDGDSSGKEIDVRPWNKITNNYNGILRYTGD